jgi:hypothetical protein
MSLMATVTLLLVFVVIAPAGGRTLAGVDLPDTSWSTARRSA